MQEELARAGSEAPAACPAEQGAAIASEIGRPPDRLPGPEERSADPAPEQGHGPAAREVPPALAGPVAAEEEGAAEPGLKI